jgi:sterol 24-C-methyltransferase
MMRRTPSTARSATESKCKYPSSRDHQTQLLTHKNSGDGISQMVKISEGLRAIKAAGFELEFHEDLAQRGDEIPWWYPLAGDMKYCRSVGDFFTVLRMTKLGRGAVHKLVGALEMVGVAPQGTQKTADTLAVAADCLVAGAKKNLFTPMYMMIARKPLNA